MFTKGTYDMFDSNILRPRRVSKCKHSYPYPVEDSMETLRAQLLSPDHCAMGTDKSPHVTLFLSDGETHTITKLCDLIVHVLCCIDTAFDATRGPAERKIQVSARSRIEIV